MDHRHPLLDLPSELRDEIFAHLSKASVEPFQWHKPTHASARRRLWQHVAVKLMDLRAFVVFVHADERFRFLIREVTVPVVEPWAVEYRDEVGRLEKRVFRLPKWWDGGVIEQLLARLPAVTTLKAKTWRGPPPREDQVDAFKEYTEAPVIHLPKRITKLEVLESIRIEEQGTGRRNLRLFAPSSSIRQVTYSTGLGWKEDPDRSCFVGGAAGFEHVRQFSNIRVMTLHIGARVESVTDSMLDMGCVLKSIGALPHLRDLEIRLPFWKGDAKIPENWPALVPSLRVFRTTARRVAPWIARTTSLHTIHFQVLVAEAEMENPRLWKDESMVTTVFKLLEETAHYLSTHKTDKRRLTLEATDILTSANRRQMKWRRDELYCDAPPAHGWEYDNLYYPPPACFDEDGMDKTREYDRYWGEMVASMPGLTDARGEIELGWDEDALNMDLFHSLAVEPWKEVRRWKPRRNLGLNWDNPLRSSRPGYVDVSLEEDIGFQ